MHVRKPLYILSDRTILNDGESCTEHSECDYLDCRGRCDLVESKCAEEGVLNDNLQNVCDRVLLGDRAGAGGMVLNRLFPGLLDSRHMNEMLKRTLKKCANPLGAKDGSARRAAAGEGTRKQVIGYQDVGK